MTLVQTEIQFDRIDPYDPPNAGWRQGSQCYQLYSEFVFHYHPERPKASEVPLVDLARIVPGGVTRRIDDLRKYLRPLGWDIVNRQARIEGQNYSWYRLAPLGYRCDRCGKYYPKADDLVPISAKNYCRGCESIHHEHTGGN